MVSTKPPKKSGYIAELDQAIGELVGGIEGGAADSHDIRSILVDPTPQNEVARSAPQIRSLPVGRGSKVRNALRRTSGCC